MNNIFSIDVIGFDHLTIGFGTKAEVLALFNEQHHTSIPTNAPGVVFDEEIRMRTHTLVLIESQEELIGEKKAGDDDNDSAKVTTRIFEEGVRFGFRLAEITAEICNRAKKRVTGLSDTEQRQHLSMVSLEFGCEVKRYLELRKKELNSCNRSFSRLNAIIQRKLIELPDSAKREKRRREWQAATRCNSLRELQTLQKVVLAKIKNDRGTGTELQEECFELVVPEVIR